MNSNLLRFIKLAQITLVLVYLVIIAGTVVRATGSGMGCPDWPTCFGKIIPPTDVSQLPDNYKQLYAGEHNNVAEFNAVKTWTEYINRLCGVLLGLFSFAQLIYSLKVRKLNKSLFRFSLLEFLLIGFQGWLGAKVVSSNLAPVKITIHMIAALIILSIAILIIHKAKKLIATQHTNVSIPLGLKNLGMLVLVISIIQIMLGTQVREQIDVLLKNFDALYRGDLISNLGIVFKIHRSFSILILLLNAFLIFKIIKGYFTNVVKNLSKWLAICLIIEVIAGICLSKFALPPSIQPIHLLFACIVYGLQFMLILKLWAKQ
ncbi:MAG: COX15/CtaA family protein [Bacteroidia bacterium]